MAIHTRANEEASGLLGLGAFLQMLLWDNFVHADLHPGNIFIELSPKNNQESSHDIREALKCKHVPQICFIDAGLVTELHPRDFDNLRICS